MVRDQIALVIRYPDRPGTFAAERFSSLVFDLPETVFPVRIESYDIVDAEVVVAEITTSRISGTFRAIATAWNWYPEPRTDTVYVTNGKFDMPIIPR